MEAKIKPDKIVETLSDIPLSLLQEWGIRGVILDVDNTILPRNSKDIPDSNFNWIQLVKQEHKVVIVSNNTAGKIKRVSVPLDLPYVSWAAKPILYYFRKAARKMGLTNDLRKICMIGDQLFTDIKGAKGCGMKTILVHPIDPSNDMIWTRIKRRREDYWLKKWSYDYSLKI